MRGSPRRSDCSAIGIVNRYAKPQSALSAGADHYRPGNRFLEPQLDVGVRESRSSGPVHLHGCEIDRPAHQRRARRPEPRRRRQPGVCAPARHLRQVEAAATLVQRRKGRDPAARRPGPAGGVGRVGPRLVVPRYHRDVETATGQAPDRERGVTSPLTHYRVAAGRKPQCHTMDPPARARVPDVGQGQEPGQIVAVAVDSVPVKHRGRLAVHQLVPAQDCFLQQRRKGRQAPSRDCPAQQHSHATTDPLSSGTMASGERYRT